MADDNDNGEPDAGDQKPTIPPPPKGKVDDKPPDDDDGSSDAQALADKAAAKARRQSASVTKKEIAETLGMSVEDAAAIIKAKQDADDKEKSDAQKATEAAQAASVEAAEMIAKAHETETRASLKIALLSPGVDPEKEPACPLDRVDDVIGMALPLALASDDEDDPIAAAIVKLRESSSWVFQSSAEPSTEGKPPPSPPGPGRKLGERTPVSKSDDDVKSKVDKWRERQAGRGALKIKE
jgi:hypothetical protein